jgi:hypothetical protein
VNQAPTFERLMQQADSISALRCSAAQNSEESAAAAQRGFPEHLVPVLSTRRTMEVANSWVHTKNTAPRSAVENQPHFIGINIYLAELQNPYICSLLVGLTEAHERFLRHGADGSALTPWTIHN